MGNKEFLDKTVRTLKENEYESFFKKFGFLVVPNVIDQNEVKTFRNQWMDSVFVEGKRKDPWLMPKDLFLMPETYKLRFNEKILTALKTLLEPQFALFSDMELHFNNYGGWHKDSDTEDGQDYLMADDYRFVKCGLLFQDNTPEWGGGIDVVPGGHKFPMLLPKKGWSFALKNIANKLGQSHFPYTIPAKAGDFLCFDSRLPHHSTQPAALQNRETLRSVFIHMPKEKSKIVLYWNSSRQNYAHAFMEHTERRAEVELKNKIPSEFFFADYVHYLYPNDYPQDFVDLVKEKNLFIPSLSEEKTRQWKEKLKSISQKT